MDNVGKLLLRSVPSYVKNPELFIESFDELKPTVGFDEAVSLLGGDKAAAICESSEVRRLINKLHGENEKIVPALNNKKLKKNMVERFVMYWDENVRSIKGKLGNRLVDDYVKTLR